MLSAAEMTNSAASAARSPARSSPTKSACPGVSTRLIRTGPAAPAAEQRARVLSTTVLATASDTDRPTRRSTSSKSQTVVPFSMLPGRLMAPVAARMASISMVLPAPPGPTRTTLRTCSAGPSPAGCRPPASCRPACLDRAGRLAAAIGPAGRHVAGDLQVVIVVTSGRPQRHRDRRPRRCRQERCQVGANNPLCRQSADAGLVTQQDAPGFGGPVRGAVSRNRHSGSSRTARSRRVRSGTSGTS